MPVLGRDQPVSAAGQVDDALEGPGADGRRVERHQIGDGARGDAAATGQAVHLRRLPGQPPDRLLEREHAELADPALQQVGGEVRVAQLAGVRAGVRQAQQQRGVLQQPADLLLVVVDHHDPEAGGQVFGERQIDRDVEGRAAALGGELAERRPVAQFLMYAGLLHRRLVELAAPLLAYSGVGPPRARPDRHTAPPVARVRARGSRRKPARWPAAPDRRALPGRRWGGTPPEGRRSCRRLLRRRPDARVRSDIAAFSRTTMMAAHVTGRPMSRASRAHSSTWKSGPQVASIVPRPLAPTLSASVQISLSSASRLGTGRPNAPRCDSERDVEKPIAPAAMPSSTSSRMRATSLGVAARSVASSPRT